MIRKLALVATASILLTCLSPEGAQAQGAEKKFEVGAQTTGTFLKEIGTRDAGTGTSAAGLGGRFSYGINDYISVDTEVNLLPGAVGKNKLQGLFGLKAGVRADKYGLFAKVRPGFMHFRSDPFGRSEPGSSLLARNRTSSTEPLIDIGGVVELYPSDSMVVRFDLGDTVIRYASRTVRVGLPTLETTAGGFTTHNVQASFGVGWRF
jgi:hypothetical protein